MTIEFAHAAPKPRVVNAAASTASSIARSTVMIPTLAPTRLTSRAIESFPTQRRTHARLSSVLLRRRRLNAYHADVIAEASSTWVPTLACRVRPQRPLRPWHPHSPRAHSFAPSKRPITIEHCACRSRREASAEASLIRSKTRRASSGAPGARLRHVGRARRGCDHSLRPRRPARPDSSLRAREWLRASL